LWFTSWYFSFNSAKWACPACQWYWYKKVELQFLPDTYVPCDLCKWKRYKPEVLDIKWKWKNIVEILEMYVSDALELFKDIWFIKEELQLMCDIGLWYLRMWQPAHTLSWWESQRLKLVKHLLKSYKWHSIYFLDEPTVWLHAQDIEKLLRVIKEFLDKWDTILMIEHDKNLLQYADEVIRLEDGEIV
jgi:excinuclease ABC subunit A